MSVSFGSSHEFENPAEVVDNEVEVQVLGQPSSQYSDRETTGGLSQNWPTMYNDVRNSTDGNSLFDDDALSHLQQNYGSSHSHSSHSSSGDDEWVVDGFGREDGCKGRAGFQEKQTIKTKTSNNDICKTAKGQHRVMKTSHKVPDCAPLIGLLLTRNNDKKQLLKYFKKKLPPPPPLKNKELPPPTEHTSEQVNSMFSRYKKKFQQGAVMGTTKPGILGENVETQVRNELYNNFAEDRNYKMNHKKLSDIIMKYVHQAPDAREILARAKTNMEKGEVHASFTNRLLTRFNLPPRLASVDTKLEGGKAMSDIEHAQLLQIIEQKKPVR